MYHYARIWRLNGFWEKLNTELREYLRVQDGKNAQPSAGSMDTQVSSSTMVGGVSGYNGYKNVKGRKREQPVSDPGPSARTARKVLSCEQEGAAVGSRRCYPVSKKRFVLVDTLGSLLKAKIVPGNWSEKDAAMVGLEGLEVVFPKMELLWADQRPCPSGASYGQEGISRLGVYSLVERDSEMGTRVNEWNF